MQTNTKNKKLILFTLTNYNIIKLIDCVIVKN
jgi:hypothetical protein